MSAEWKSLDAGAITRGPTCPYCGTTHSFKCPLIKALEYDQKGTVRRVEFSLPLTGEAEELLDFESEDSRIAERILNQSLAGEVGDVAAVADAINTLILHRIADAMRVPESLLSKRGRK